MRMQAKANSFDLKETKAPIIHGETEIVLKNVKTGLVERIHSENTFQGGMIAKYLHGGLDTRPTFQTYDNNAFTIAPWKALVGGVLLFRDSIEAGNQFMPAGNIMVAKGAIDIANSGDPSEMGSYNSVESSATANAITQVYDFATNQGNGQIGCVCLTSKEGGFVGYGNGSYTRTSMSTYPLGRFYNSSAPQISTGAIGTLAADGKRYSFHYDNGIMTIRKYRTCGTATGSVFSGLYTEHPHDVSSFPETFRGGVVFYCGNNIFRLIPQNDYTVAAGGTINYIEYNAATDTLEIKSLLNSYNATLRISSTSYYGNVLGFTKDGRLAAWKNTGFSGGGAPVLIDIATGTVVFDGSDSPIYNTGGLSGIMEINPNLYYLNWNGAGVILDVLNETIKPVDSYSTGTITNGEAGYFQKCVTSESSYLAAGFSNPLYLATINNLQTPVTKTSAQTMKVTYTLTEV